MCNWKQNENKSKIIIIIIIIIIYSVKCQFCSSSKSILSACFFPIITTAAGNC